MKATRRLIVVWLQFYAVAIQPTDLAATAGSKKYLGVNSNLDMGPKVWQKLDQGLKKAMKNPAPFLTGKKAIFEGR